MSGPGDWCTWDPPVRVAVDGHPVAISLFLSLPHDDVALAQQETKRSAVVEGNSIILTVTGPNVEWRVQARIEALGLSAGSTDIHRPGETITIRFDNVQPPGQ